MGEGGPVSVHLTQQAADPHVLLEFGLKLRSCMLFMVCLMMKSVASLRLLLEG